MRHSKWIIRRTRMPLFRIISNLFKHTITFNTCKVHWSWKFKNIIATYYMKRKSLLFRNSDFASMYFLLQDINDLFLLYFPQNSRKKIQKDSHHPLADKPHLSFCGQEVPQIILDSNRGLYSWNFLNKNSRFLSTLRNWLSWDVLK